MRQRVTPLVLLRWLLYALVPILTLGVEDGFCVDILGYEPVMGQFRIERSGVTPMDVASVLLLGLTVPLWFRRRNRTDLKVFGLLAAAVLVSGVYGLYRGPDRTYSLFEPSIWKTFVLLFALTMAFNAVFEDRGRRRRFVSWFCGVQFAYATIILARYLFLGVGQPTYFGERVPVFAGDMLIFFVIAYAISLFRLATAPRLREAAYIAAFALVIMLSLRRSFMAPLLTAPLFFFGVELLGLVRSRRAKRRPVLTFGVLAALAWVFFSFVGPLRLPTDIVMGRFRSLNLIWAETQSETLYTSVGHTDDFLDAAETAVKNPLLGQGLAVWFPLYRTERWQEANVHAGLFKTWIKLGLLGALGYVVLLGRGLRLWRDLKINDDRAAERLFAVWFPVHFLLLSVYMNSILFGYKNSFVVAMYLALCTSLVAASRNSSQPALARAQGRGRRGLQAATTTAGEM